MRVVSGKTSYKRQAELIPNILPSLYDKKQESN